jgi:hypothetical protein
MAGNLMVLSGGKRPCPGRIGYETGSREGGSGAGFKSELIDDTYGAFFTLGAKGKWEFAPHFSLGSFFKDS